MLVAIAIGCLSWLLFFSAWSRTLYYSGPISLKLVEEIQQFPIGKLDRIIIDSGGGRYDAALDAASIIQANNIQVVVDGYCLSACASIILPAGHNNIAKPNSLIGFHNLPGLWFYLDRYTQTKYEISLQDDSGYSASKRTVDLFHKAKINPDIFVVLALEKGANCIGFDKEGYRDSRVYVNFTSDLIVPNRHIFDQFNWAFEKLDTPFNPVEIEKLVAPLRHDNPKLKVKIMDENFRYPTFMLNGDLGFTRFAKCLD